MSGNNDITTPMLKTILDYLHNYYKILTSSPLYEFDLAKVKKTTLKLEEILEQREKPIERDEQLYRLYKELSTVTSHLGVLTRWSPKT